GTGNNAPHCLLQSETPPSVGHPKGKNRAKGFIRLKPPRPGSGIIEKKKSGHRITPRRPRRRRGLRPCGARHGRERGSARGQMQKLSSVGKFHRFPPRKAKRCKDVRITSHR